MNFTEEQWNQLADLLRSEIEGYGRLFGLLEDQHKTLVQHNLEALIGVNARLEEHTESLAGLRRHREGLVRRLAEEAGLDPDASSLKDLLGHCPDQSGPMFEECLKEVNRLIDSSRSKLECNQMLLHRCRDIGQSFLQRINPDQARDGRYARSGKTCNPAHATSRGHYQARA